MSSAAVLGNSIEALRRRLALAKDHYSLLCLALAVLIARAFIPSVVSKALTVDSLECIEELLSFAYITALMVFFDRCSWSRGWKWTSSRMSSDSEEPEDVRSSTSTLGVLLSCL
mmetsp:Transcript_5784/g.13737  ORF Transcript_5784/g.13737 Transcript_5784/m.13737 type:complete len:114 (-) Transcript_5784:169-510(-)